MAQSKIKVENYDSNISNYPRRISKREIEILRLVAHEYTTSMIAKKLFLSKHTVDSHRKRLMGKLGVKNSAGLVRRGFELGVIQLYNASRPYTCSSNADNNVHM